MSERAPQQESFDEVNELISFIGQNGPEHPDVVQKIRKWVESEMRHIQHIEEPRSCALMRIDFERKMSRLHVAAGHIGPAIQDLEDARMIALNEYFDDLVPELDARIDELVSMLDEQNNA